MSMDTIKARGQIDRLQTQLREINDFLSENDDLPHSVESAISIKQDILIHDISSLRARLRVGRNE